MSKKGSKRFWKSLNGEISIQNGDFSILNGENALKKKEKQISKKRFETLLKKIEWRKYEKMLWKKKER